jgi:hypothetical protein
MIKFRKELDNTDPNQNTEKKFLINLTRKILASVIRQKYKNKISNVQYWVRGYESGFCAYIHIDVTNVYGWGWNIAVEDDDFVVDYAPSLRRLGQYPMADPDSIKRIINLIVYCISKTIDVKSFFSEDIDEILNNYEGELK